MRVMIDRDQVICSSIPGQTEWAKKVDGTFGEIELMVDNKCDFKLGEIVDVVAFYYPDHEKLYFVRRATAEEIKSEDLNPLSLLESSEVDC